MESHTRTVSVLSCRIILKALCSDIRKQEQKLSVDVILFGLYLIHKRPPSSQYVMDSYRPLNGNLAKYQNTIFHREHIRV
jgi:hypothetical protein